MCEQMLSAFYEVDHRVALWRGGTNEASNLQALCRECHAKKGAEERAVQRVPTVLREERTRRSVDMFNALFEPWSGGAFPLAVAKHLCFQRFGLSFDERQVSVDLEPHMVFPPHWASMFVQAGMVPEREGPVMQAVRPRKGVMSARRV